MYRILILFFILTLNFGCKGADTAQRPEASRFYEWLITQAEQQTGHKLIPNPYQSSSDDYDWVEFAKDRIIAAANNVLDQHAKNPQSSYEIDLQYLVGINGQPKHFTLKIQRNTVDSLIKQE